MQGLLGNSMDDPRTMAVLQGVMGLLGARGNVQGVAQGLLGYQGAMQQAKQQAAQEDERAMRRQMAELQLRQAQQQAAKAQAIDAAYKGAIRTPEQMAMAAHGGPTNAAAQAAPGMAPGFDQNALIRGLTQADTMAAAQMLQPKPADYKVVGDALLQVGPGGVKEAYRAPAKPEAMPTSIQEYLYAQKNPDFLANQLRLKQAGATRLNVDAGQRFENEYSKAQGKSFSDFKEKVNAAGFSAPAQLRKLERMEQLLTGVDGGKLSPVGLEVASALNSIGIKVDPRLGNKEASEALARELAGGLRQPGTGPMTDKDFENFLTQVPSLSKTADGRKQIMKTMRSALTRDMQIAKMAREYQRRSGGVLDDGFMDEAAQYIAENPVISLPDEWRVER